MSGWADELDRIKVTDNVFHICLDYRQKAQLYPNTSIAFCQGQCRRNEYNSLIIFPPLDIRIYYPSWRLTTRPDKKGVMDAGILWCSSGYNVLQSRVCGVHNLISCPLRASSSTISLTKSDYCSLSHGPRFIPSSTTDPYWHSILGHFTYTSNPPPLLSISAPVTNRSRMQ